MQITTVLFQSGLGGCNVGHVYQDHSFQHGRYSLPLQHMIWWATKHGLSLSNIEIHRNQSPGSTETPNPTAKPEVDHHVDVRVHLLPMLYVTTSYPQYRASPACPTHHAGLWIFWILQSINTDLGVRVEVWNIVTWSIKQQIARVTMPGCSVNPLTCWCSIFLGRMHVDR